MRSLREYLEADLADDNQLRVTIVLDDGSVQTGFAKIQQAADKTAKNIDEGVGSSLKDAFKNISNPVDILAGATIIGKVINEIKEKLLAVANLTLLGESVTAAEAQFNNLAQSAGVSADAIRTGLDKASAGLVDNSDLTAAASEGIVRLGLNAERLPQIFELARKATIAFGGDTLTNFNKITTAISTGNQVALKRLGLTVDLAKANKKFEESNGIAVGSINDFERQQVALNEVLKVGGERLKGVSTSLTPIADSLKVSKNEFKDLAEAAGFALAQVITPLFQKTGESSNSFTKGVALDLRAAFGGPVDEAKAQINSLENQLRKVQDLQAKGLTSASLTGNAGEVTNLASEYESLSKDLARAKSNLEAFQGQVNGKVLEDPRSARAANDARAEEALKLIEEQKRRRLQTEAVFNQESLAFTSQRIKDEAAIEKVGATALEIADIDQNTAREEAANNHAQQLKKINDEFLIQKVITQEQANKLILQANEDFNNKIALQDELRQFAADQKNQSALDGINSFAKGFQDQAEAVAASAKKNFQQAGVQAFNTFTSGVGNAFASVGKALVKGEDGLQAFGKALIGTVGQVAQQLGNTYIAQGIAELFATHGVSGSGLIAAGAALEVAGGALSASAGGGASSSGASGGGYSTDTSGATGGGVSVGQTPTADSARNVANSQVNVNVQGNILNNRDSALYIADILNEQFKSGGVIFGAT